MLLIDAGNTRLKWAGWDGERLDGQGQCAYGSGPRQAAQQCMSSVAAPGRVLVGHVAGPEVATALTDAARSVHGLACEFVSVRPEGFGVRIAYRRPERLGVDRWLAMIGARWHSDRATLVADAGTALTVDGLTACGKHLGGLIAPGIDLMRRVLLDRTARIDDAGAGGYDRPPMLFADDTGPAVTAGAVYGNAALVDRAATEMTARLGSEPLIVLTGGAARRMAPAMGVPVELIDDLVLRGLARVALGEGGQ